MFVTLTTSQKKFHQDGSPVTDNSEQKIENNFIFCCKKYTSNLSSCTHLTRMGKNQVSKCIEFAELNLREKFSVLNHWSDIYWWYV